MKLRKFNAHGLDSMRDCLDRARQGEPLDFTQSIEDPDLTEIIDSTLEISYRAFHSRLAAGRFFNQVVGPIGPDADRDVGMWSWLSAVWAPSLAPEGKSVGRDYRWILEPANHQTYYRHLLAFPTLMVKTHGGDESVLSSILAGPLYAPGEINEQLGSVQEIAGCRSLLEAATALYVKPDTGEVRRGAASKGPGSARRLREVIGQFVLTWDFYEMDAVQVLAMLPPEFERFGAK